MNITNLAIVKILRPDDTVIVANVIHSRTVICFRRRNEHEVELDEAGPDDHENLFLLQKTGTPGELSLVPVEHEEIENLQTVDLLQSLHFWDIASRIVFAYRDTDLSEDLAARYTPGLLLAEAAPVDASIFRGCPYRNTRFLIASPDFSDLSPFSLDTRSFPHLTLLPGSLHRVVDIHHVADKRQITLLSLPQPLLSAIADHAHTKAVRNILARLVQNARTDFEDRLAEDDPEEVAGDTDWNERISFPIGSNGNS